MIDINEQYQRKMFFLFKIRDYIDMTIATSPSNFEISEPDSLLQFL